MSLTALIRISSPIYEHWQNSFASHHAPSKPLGTYLQLIMEASQMCTTASNVSILDLPDEILEDIFLQLLYVGCACRPQVVSWYDDSYIRIRGMKLLPLTLVCQRFNSIVTPRLYGMMDFSPGLFAHAVSWWNPRSLFKLRTISENPVLASYCRGLVIRYTGGGSLDSCRAATLHFMKLTSLLTQTTSLILHYECSPFGKNDHVFKILNNAVSHMPTLKSLTLGCLVCVGSRFADPSVAAACLLRLSCHPSLTKLRVKGMDVQTLEYLWPHLTVSWKPTLVHTLCL